MIAGLPDNIEDIKGFLAQDEAEALYREVVETRDFPDTIRTRVMKTLATLEAVRRGPAEAMDWLRQGVDEGTITADRLLEDSIFEPLYGPDFDELVERARENAEAQQGK